MYRLDYTGKFRKDLKLCQKCGYNIDAIRTVIQYLENDGQVPQDYKPHKLVGKDYIGLWECHIEPNWLLIYDVQDTIKLISLIRTGTHSDLF